ncbi:MAG: hypothetical protein LC631_07245 [Desulfovibrionales bacterium]|nr:hypothetical protein [Desulfovibrionales bacterium]
MTDVINIYRKIIILLSIFVMMQGLIASPGMSQGCTIRGQTYLTELSQKKYRGIAGKPVLISIKTDPSSLPHGYFAANNLTVRQAPEKPEIVSGHPDIRVICHEPGEYIFQITTSILSKSSCGGIESCSMQPQTVKLIIEAF